MFKKFFSSQPKIKKEPEDVIVVFNEVNNQKYEEVSPVVDT